MPPSERLSLSYFSLLVSVIISVTCMGLMIPYAQARPFVFGSILFTLVYYRPLFPVSAFVNENPGHQPRSYIFPLDHPRTVQIIIFFLFWLATFIPTLTLGNISNFTNVCLDIRCGLEIFLTVYIAYLCWKKLRNRRARWESDAEVTIESIIHFRQGLPPLFFFLPFTFA